MLLRPRDDRPKRLPEPLEHECAGVLSREGQRRVEDIGRGEPEVEPAAVVAEVFGDRVHERGYVVVRRALDLGDARRIGCYGRCADARDRLGWHGADLGPAVERRELDGEPPLERRLSRPDPRHGGAGVARDHPVIVDGGAGDPSGGGRRGRHESDTISARSRIPLLPRLTIE